MFFFLAYYINESPFSLYLPYKVTSKGKPLVGSKCNQALNPLGERGHTFIFPINTNCWLPICNT